jgi:uncharacterized protein YodC (DUF2158 family)
MNDFKIGDIVMLISGGPKMIVKDANEDAVTCEWFDGSKHKEIKFFIKCLEHVKPKPKLNLPIPELEAEKMKWLEEIIEKSNNLNN